MFHMFSYNDIWQASVAFHSGHTKPLPHASQNSHSSFTGYFSLLKGSKEHFFKGSFIMLADLGIFDYFISSLSSRHISIHTKYSKYSKLTLHCGNWSEGGRMASSFLHFFFFFSHAEKERICRTTMFIWGKEYTCLFSDAHFHPSSADKWARSWS